MHQIVAYKTTISFRNSISLHKTTPRSDSLVVQSFFHIIILLGKMLLLLTILGIYEFVHTI